ncbi:MAG TPA: hypothetical protein VMV77_04660 [Bacteroidales bacterium]|nr:hypothetical protein [Bacteroidales bacterium]
MTDPITIERAELHIIVDRAIEQTLNELGIKRNTFNPYISQRQAAKLVGRGRLERAMEEGRVEWFKPSMDKSQRRVYVKREDVEKMLNNPMR